MCWIDGGECVMSAETSIFMEYIAFTLVTLEGLGWSIARAIDTRSQHDRTLMQELGFMLRLFVTWPSYLIRHFRS